MAEQVDEHLDRLRRAREHAQAQASRRSIQYLLGRCPGDEYEYGRLSIDETTVYNEFTEILAQNITDDLITPVQENNKPIREFDIRHTDKNRTPIQYLSVEKLPEFVHLDQLLSNNTSFDTTTYHQDENDDLEIEVIRIKAPGDEIVLGIQEFSSEYLLGSTMWTRLIKRPGEDHYDRFEKQVVGVPDDVRAIVYDGYLYSDSPKALERIFDFREKYEEEVDEVRDAYAERGIKLDIDDDLMDTLRGDIRHLRKFHEMKELNVHKEASKADIRRVIKERDLPITCTSKNDELHLSVESGHNRWELLDILADDHVVSEITDNPYNVEGGKELVDD